MPDPQLPTLLLNDLAGTGMDRGRGMSTGGSEAMPRFAGNAGPGETVFFSIDGDEFEVPIDQNGLWDFAAPELSNDTTHDFEMWTQNEEGDESSRQEWSTRVSANQQEREAQRARNDDWHSRGQQAWRDENQFNPPQGLTPTPVSAGSAGGAGQAGGASGGGGGGAGGAGGGTAEETGEYPPTPVGGFEKGNTAGG